MIVALDIGNTSITIGIIKGKRVSNVLTVETALSQVQLRAKLGRVIGGITKKHGAPKGVVICSVVPKATKIAEAVIKGKLGQKALVIGRDLKVPIKNNYRYPRQVGQDRLVCAYAAKCLYGAPAIIIDFGTAITFDLVSHRGNYEGGIIVPGIRLSAEALFHKTALLPSVETIKVPRNLIGKDTKESILSGIFFGYGSLCSGLIDTIAKKIRGRPKVIVTGGYTHLMRKFISTKINHIEKNLVFKGMALLYKRRTLKSN
jgi:type III pantothenate kinase